MQKLDFGEALELIYKRDSRYDRDAYHFLRDALDYTIKQRKKAKAGTGHVTGQQLLEGIRNYALKQYGPMVPVVLGYWGIQKCEDFGEMVFNLIRMRIFGKTESDSLDDFKGGFTFHEAFVVPFLPDNAPNPARPPSHPRPEEYQKRPI
ncbi:MAG TPA: Minf_1886 family protein [Chthoniobacteraceae bacterium]|jgi:uncharacterized repeat protein (TIGR04138 family)